MPSSAGTSCASTSTNRAVETLGDLLRVMMDALRQPNQAIREIIISQTSGQNPREKQLVDLKAPMDGEEALLEAFHAQVTNCKGDTQQCSAT